MTSNVTTPIKLKDGEKIRVFDEKVLAGTAIFITLVVYIPITIDVIANPNRYAFALTYSIYAIFTVANSLWLAYGVLAKSLITIVFAAISLFISIFLLILIAVLGSTSRQNVTIQKLKS